MQTLTFGIQAFRARCAGLQAVRDTPGNFSTASDSLEAPVVAPFTKTSARVDPDLFHPGVDGAEAMLSIEIEDDVGVRNIYLVLEHYSVRVP